MPPRRRTRSLALPAKSVEILGDIDQAGDGRRPGLTQVNRFAVNSERNTPDRQQVEPGRSDDDVRLQLLAGLQENTFFSEAFDAVSPEAIVEAMNDRGIDPKVVLWYENYIRERISICNYKGETVSRLLTIGCPQGGILSPLVWGLVFDKLIKMISRTSTSMYAFADDGTLLAFGESINKSIIG